jgi:hypothetical protein
MSTTIQGGNRFITLPNSPTAEDYVITRNDTSKMNTQAMKPFYVASCAQGG